MLSKVIDFEISTLRLLVRPKQVKEASPDWADVTFSELVSQDYKEFFVSFESQGAWTNDRKLNLFTRWFAMSVVIISLNTHNPP